MTTNFAKNGIMKKNSTCFVSQFKEIAILIFDEKNGQTYYFTCKMNELANINTGFFGIDSHKFSECVIKYICPLSIEVKLKAHLQKLNPTLVKGRSFSTPSIDFYVIENRGTFRLEKKSEQNQSNLKVASSNTSKKEVRNSSVPYKVLIVDDSPTIRKILAKAISQMKGFSIVAETGNPLEVFELVKKHNPDAMTLDLHMPHLNGVEVLEKLGPLTPPTIVVSSIGLAEGDLVIKALESGAIDYLQKPTLDNAHTMFENLKEKLEVAVAQKPRKTKTTKPAIDLKNANFNLNIPIFIGSSTGGTEALKEIFIRLPKEIPPILVVQHIPPVYSRSLANRLNQLCPFSVKEAEDGDKVIPGQVLIAPGGHHMEYIKTHGGSVKVYKGELHGGHMPSVDILFDSAAKNLAGPSMGVILTGMGRDGAIGLKSMRDKGAYTIGQDEESCVVYGMPKAAYTSGAVCRQASLHEIPQALLEEQKSAKINKSAS